MTSFIIPIEKRRERVVKASFILAKLTEQGPIEYIKAASILSLALGVRLEKAKEYIKVLANAEFSYHIENGLIGKIGQEFSSPKTP